MARFGVRKIHNTKNLIRLPNGKGSIHAKVSGYYSSYYKDSHIRVRDYVKTLSSKVLQLSRKPRVLPVRVWPGIIS